MWSLNYGSLIDSFLSSSSSRSAPSVVRVSFLCIARKWCVRRGVNAIRVSVSVCRATLCSALSKAPLIRGGPSDRTLNPTRLSQRSSVGTQPRLLSRLNRS